MKHDRYVRSIAATMLAAAIVVSGRQTVAAQQTPPGASRLSLADALRLAEESSEQVGIAEAGVQRARGQERQARSEYFPQLFASAGYTRTLATEFSSFGGGGTSDTIQTPACGTFMPNPSLPLQERVDSLEKAVDCAANANPFAAFSDLPFGRENQVNLGLSLSQTVFSGGRVQAQNRIADATRETAEIGFRSARAQLALDVTQAYYDAQLTDRLLAIAQGALEQAETTLTQVRLAEEVGNQPEFELLRAQVTRDTQQPVVIQRAADRDLAHMRLKQLLDLPLDAPLELTTDLDNEAMETVVPVVARALDLELDTTVDARAPVRQAAKAVDVQQDLVRVARAQRLPSLQVSSQYGRVAYPSDGFPGWNDFRTNWTVSASASVPLFTGGRIRGDEMVAEANLREARERLDMTRELAALDNRNAVERLRAAEATWRASAGTVQQAVKAYSIAEIRFQEGISTQLELNDSRLVMQQARANRVLASRDLQVARVRVALLPYLPLGSTSGSSAGQAPDVTTQQQTQQQAAPRTQQTGTSTQGGAQGGVAAQASRAGGGND
jgi:outer membrane protein TolC